MNLSLIITLVLIAIIIPWFWRRLFSRPTPTPAPSLFQVKSTLAEEEKEPQDAVSKSLDYLLNEHQILLPTQKNYAVETVQVQRDLLQQNQYRLIKVIAAPNAAFAGYELLQALQNVGFEYGPDQLFHFYADDESDDILFSVASSKPPGFFDLQTIGSFSTPALTVFIDMQLVKCPETIYPLMEKVSNTLADELDGEVVLYE